MQIIYSIIVPVFNAEHFLRKCLDSLLLQDFSNFEVICINDGSTDNSLQIIEEYATQYANIIIVNRENRGASSSRNEGISIAKGEYILFVDSDDFYYHHHVLSDLYRIIKENPDTDCIYFPGGCITPEWSGNEQYESKHYDNGWDCLIDNCRKSKILVFGSVYSQCYKKDILISNNLFFDKNLIYSEDRLFVIKFFYFAKKTIVYTEPLYCYNVHSGSLMTSDNQELKINNVKKSAELIYEFCLQHSISNNSAIYTYANGLYISSVLEEYKLQKSIKLNKSFLLATSIGILKKFQSILLLIHPVLYTFYKDFATKLTKLLKKTN